MLFPKSASLQQEADCSWTNFQLQLVNAMHQLLRFNWLQ